MGYVVPVGVDGEVVMNRVDMLATPAANIITKDIMDFLFLDAPPASGPQARKLLGVRALYVFRVSIERRDRVMNICCLKHLDVRKSKHLLFISAVVLFCLP
jgi:hypothetical protein